MSQPARRPVAIIQTGLPPQPIERLHGNFSRMICRSGGLDDAQVDIVSVHEGEALADPGQYRAAVITGSPAMVSDRADWSERTAGWLRQAVDGGLPVLGICYGHQLLAHALGGEVGYNPKGREVGTQPIALLDGAGEHPLLRDCPPRFPAHLIHQQSVLSLPAGAKVLARTDHDSHQVVQYREAVLSTQYHPEFDAEIMATYLEHYTARLGTEGFDIDALKASLQATPHARSILTGFLQRYAS